LTLSAGDRVRWLAEDIDGAIAGIRPEAAAYRERLETNESIGDLYGARRKLLSDVAEAVGDYLVGLRRQRDELCEVLDRAKPAVVTPRVARGLAEIFSP
jgi:hypothetical protein